MAKTNSRTKAKTITFTPASSGKSTYKPLSSNTKTTNSKPSMQKLSSTSGNVVKGQGYKAPGSNVKVTKPVTNTAAPRTRAGVSRGNTPGTSGKYEKKLNTQAALKQRALERKAAEKAATEKAARERITKSQRVPASERLGGKKTTINPAERRALKTAEAQAKKVAAAKALRLSKFTKVAKVAGKNAAVAAGITAIGFGAKKLYDNSKGKKDSGKKDTSNSGKPKVGGNETGIKTDNLLKTPSLKDELKKKGVDYKPAKDKWGRGASSKWYGFNPETKKYESPVTSNKKDERTGSLGKDIIKAGEKLNASKKTKPEDNFGSVKKTETKPAVKKPATTPKATTPTVKKAEPVGTLTPKTTQEIANKSLEEKKTIEPAKTSTPTATAATTSSTSSSSTTSPSATSTQPRATIANKIRGALNASRERRAEKAEARGNEGRAEKLRGKIEDTSKKMMMKKGGAVKSKSKKK